MESIMAAVEPASGESQLKKALLSPQARALTGGLWGMFISQGSQESWSTCRSSARRTSNG
jgi:hypothetical protein